MKIRIIIAYFLLLIFILTQKTFGQTTGFVDVVGDVSCQTDINGTLARLVENQKPIDSLFLSWDGQYDFRLELNNEYIIEFEKNGYVLQKIYISTHVPKEVAHKIWTISPSHELIEPKKGQKEADFHTLSSIKYYKLPEGEGFFTQSESNALKKIVDKKHTDNIKPDLSKVDIEEDSDDLDSILQELVADGVLQDYSSYTDELYVDEEDLKELEHGLEKLKDKTKQDSLKLFEKNIEIQNELLNNSRYQLEIARMNARSRADSLGIKERERRINLAEQEIENAQNRLKLKNYEIRNQRIVAISSITGFILTLILFVFVYSNFKVKKRLNKTLEHQNKTLEAQGQGLEQANYLLSMQNVEITASISYAKRIQDAILPSNYVLKQYFQDIFIMFKPKDIVSGDFYWAEKIENKIYFAVIDCTGHGVPGAFMSIIGNRLLNEVIFIQRIHDPKMILETLNKGIKQTLQQDVTDNNDGMDICLIEVEQIADKKFKVIFAGAKRPLFYYVKELDEVLILKGDRKPIGGKYYQEVVFTNKEIILSKDDVLYLTSDGIVDQNNPELKKLGSRKFIEILKNNASKPLAEQHKLFEYELDIHQQGEDQRDDITIVGIKL